MMGFVPLGVALLVAFHSRQWIACDLSSQVSIHNAA